MGRTGAGGEGDGFATVSRIHAVSLRLYGRVDSSAGYWLGIALGVVIGLIDVFFPGSGHNMAYYVLIYGSLGLFSGYFAANTAYRIFIVRALGIASVSMGFWAIAWTLYYLAFNYSEWREVFITTQTIGIGMGINVPIQTYLFSTFVQAAGGAFLIFLTTPTIFDRLLAYAKARFIKTR